MRTEDGERRLQQARRFVRTAVVVDDRICMEEQDLPKPRPVEPDRPRFSEQNMDITEGTVDHRLNARPIMDGFASLGIICSTLAPEDRYLNVIRRADIIVLDWRLGSGKEIESTALPLIRRILSGDADRHALRLIGIYTADPELTAICSDICDELERLNLSPIPCKHSTTINYRHGRIVIYAKNGARLQPGLTDRKVSEECLSERLLEDFSVTVDGLLPGIALAALTAVREGEHRILDQFAARLDPAYLAHMCCLPNPADAERQFGVHLADELHGLVEAAISAESPAGVDKAKHWIRKHPKKTFPVSRADGRNGDRNPSMLCQVELSAQGALDLIDRGFDEFLNTDGARAQDRTGERGQRKKLTRTDFQSLSQAFSAGGEQGLDQELAWSMNFRTVYNPHISLQCLWLGTVVFREDDDKHLLCVRPRCDCVRLTESTVFPFLELMDTDKGKQLVVRAGENFRRLGVKLDPSGWMQAKFQPSEHSGAVIAHPSASPSSSSPYFCDVKGRKYVWRGELKPEYFHRIAQMLARQLDRVAIDDSEWLRRIERL